MKHKIYNLMGQSYYVDRPKKVVYMSTDKGDFKVSFAYLDGQIKMYRGANRIHKPLYLLFYTDFKNNNLSDYKYDVLDDVLEPEKIIHFKETISKFEYVK